MKFKSCEEYVLKELERVQNELLLTQKANEELKSDLDTANNDFITLEKTHEELTLTREKMALNLMEINYLNWKKECITFNKNDFTINYKEKLLELGITKEEQETYAKKRLEESDQEEN